MKEQDPYIYADEPEFSISTDFTKWLEKEEKEKNISSAIELSIDPHRDSGLFQFLKEYLDLGIEADTELILRIELSQKQDQLVKVKIVINDQVFEDIKAQEVLKRIQTSRTFLFHSSVETRSRYGRVFRGILGEISEEHAKRLKQSEKTVNTVLKRIARSQSQEIENLLGRLKEKYKVGLSFPSFDLSFFPYELTLGDQKVDVKLDEWGSGTKNRTLALLTIFRAKQVSESSASASKVTPIIVIEEPESFLHPLAQAEFGRILQDLAEEFKVQIIVTTHSPYLLSQERPESNILLERHLVRGLLRETKRTVTTGDNWMEPFVLSLGIKEKEFKPWRDILFTGAKSILLVEGEMDKKYFELLRDKRHGENTLSFEGDISSYEGIGSLKQQTLLRFIRDKFQKLFITYDLDSEAIVKDTLDALGFERKINYLPIGVDIAGKRSIEGLLPDKIRTAVYSENPLLVQALGGVKEEREDALKQLKVLFFRKFNEESIPGEEYFGKFYTIVKLINKALN
jgi:hypothetical protein